MAKLDKTVGGPLELNEAQVAQANRDLAFLNQVRDWDGDGDTEQLLFVDENGTIPGLTVGVHLDGSTYFYGPAADDRNKDRPGTIVEVKYNEANEPVELFFASAEAEGATVGRDETGRLVEMDEEGEVLRAADSGDVWMEPSLFAVAPDTAYREAGRAYDAEGNMVAGYDEQYEVWYPVRMEYFQDTLERAEKDFWRGRIRPEGRLTHWGTEIGSEVGWVRGLLK